MKRLFVRDMKIPLCITLLALSCTLLIFAVGCNDSAVTEIDVDNQDEQLELIPPSANSEPPELVAEYHNLWDEIIRDQLDGEVDSTKVLKAQSLAVELAKYDGPMAFIFKINEAKAQGKSKQELREIVEERYGLTRLAQVSDPCMENCVNDLAREIGNAMDDHQDGINTCYQYTGLAGFVGGLAGFWPGVVGGAGTWFICSGAADRNYHKALNRAEKEYHVCLQRCGPN